MRKKFVGDKKSIEATSNDGRLWEIHLFDRGHLTKFVDATQADLDRMVAQKGLKPAPSGR